MVQESQGTTNFVQCQYHSIMQRVAENGDQLNDALSAYFVHGNVGLISGVLILFGANQAFRGSYLSEYMHQLKLEGFTEHLPDVNAYFINTNLDALARHQMKPSAIFYLFCIEAHVAEDIQASYPFLHRRPSISFWNFYPEHHSVLQNEPAVDEYTPCPVCLDQMDTSVQLLCRHELCARCLSHMERCPLCQAQIAGFTWDGQMFKK